MTMYRIFFILSFCFMCSIMIVVDSSTEMHHHKIFDDNNNNTNGQQYHHNNDEDIIKTTNLHQRNLRYLKGRDDVNINNSKYQEEINQSNRRQQDAQQQMKDNVIVDHNSIVTTMFNQIDPNNSITKTKMYTIGTTTKSGDHSNIQKENELDQQIELMKIKLLPKELRTVISPSSRQVVYEPRQFLHLHHMKTAGTSIDQLIDCGRTRFENNYYYYNTNNEEQKLIKEQSITTIPYYNLHECDEIKYEMCYNNGNSNNMNNNQCQNDIYNASIMSYCAPLYDLEYPFGWKKKNEDEEQQNQESSSSSTFDSSFTFTSTSSNNNMLHAITVLRHPVDRVWSMYRFKTNDCYNCYSLEDVYNIIDNPESDDEYSSTDDDDNDNNNNIDLCVEQLNNHMTKNLLHINHKEYYINGLLDNTNNNIVNEAINNMKSFFTFIGITEELTKTIQMIGYVFPWLNETIIENNTNQKTCKIKHLNSSPQNNQCGINKTHLELPDHPDEKTRQLIIKHNQLDIKLYEAALDIFRIQQIALNL